MSHGTTIYPGEAVFCPACGERLERRVVAGIDRGVCPACERIEFRTHPVGVAAVVRDPAGRLLLVQRSASSTKPGLWCMPAGFVDYAEDVQEAAAREVLEETGLEVTVGGVVHVRSNRHDPAKITVALWFDADAVGGELEAGDDAVDVGWFALDELPPLAFEGDRIVIDRLA